jgi:hypothetical protein
MLCNAVVTYVTSRLSVQATALAVCCGLLVASVDVASAATPKRVNIGVRHSEQGKVLVQSLKNGGYYYLYAHVTKRKGGKDVGCDAKCQQLFVKIKSKRRAHALSGVDAQLLGLTKHHQVTYAGHPLYWYSMQSGELNVEASNEFGGYWYAIAPNGHFNYKRPR